METEQVSRALTYVRRADKQWRFIRWALVLAGVALIAFSIVWPKLHAEQLEQLFIEQMGASGVQRPAGPFDGFLETAFLQTLVHTLVYSRISLILGFGLVAFTIGRWRGNPVHTVVLALAESAVLSSDSDSDA